MARVKLLTVCVALCTFQHVTCQRLSGDSEDDDKNNNILPGDSIKELKVAERKVSGIEEENRGLLINSINVDNDIHRLKEQVAILFKRTKWQAKKIKKLEKRNLEQFEKNSSKRIKNKNKLSIPPGASSETISIRKKNNIRKKPPRPPGRYSENVGNSGQSIPVKQVKTSDIDSVIKRKEKPVVAFTAHMERGLYQLTATGNATVPFDKTVLNLGNGYDSKTFRFSCPVHGVYMFSFSLYTDGMRDSSFRRISSANLMHRDDQTGQEHIVCAINSPGGNVRVQGSSTGMVQCKQNDMVYVTAYQTKGNQIWGDSGIPYSIFTGTLINAL